MRKITVKHYLDKRLKSEKKSKKDFLLKDKDGHFYPLYVQVITKRQNTKFKSNLAGFGNANSSGRKNAVKGLDHPIVKKQVDLEKNNIVEIVKLLRPFENKGFHLARFSRIYEKASMDLRVLLGNNHRQQLQDVIMASALKDLGGIVNWDLEYHAIIKGLNKVFNAKAQSALWKSLKNKVLRIDFAMACYERYAGKREILFHRWIADGHQTKFEDFVRKKMLRAKNYHKQAIPRVNEIVKNYFLSLLEISTNDDWLKDNKPEFDKFTKEITR